MEKRFRNLKRMRVLLIMAALLFVSFSVNGQTISGKVTEKENGLPIPGVNIVVKGTTDGTITDLDGNYSIAVPESATLVFSYIGYITQEVVVASQTVIDVSLETDATDLGEVVVVGYGTMKKSDLTGAVASVSGDALESSASNRAVESVAGRLAGVSVTRSSGVPGSGMKVRIRGTGSTNKSDPLYVVDGVPAGTDIDYIASEDIESIEVLKDASSTAIYGNRGANGVIIVTTKSGKLQKPVFSFNSYYGVAQVPKKIDLVNAYEHATLIAEAAANDGSSLAADIKPRIDYVLANNSEGTDWQDEIFQLAALQNYNLSVRGGLASDKKADRNLTYSVSGSYYDEEGIIKNTGTKRYLLNSKTEFQFNSRVKAGMQLDLFSRERGNHSQGIYSSPISMALSTPPMDYGLDSNGEYVAMQTFPLTENPFVTIDHNKHVKKGYTSYGLKTWLGIDIIEGLNFKTTLSLSKGFTHNKTFRPTFYLNASQNREKTELFEQRGENYGWTWINLINYTKIFADVHKIIATLGHESRYTRSSYFSATGLGLPSDEIYQYFSTAKEFSPIVGAGQGQTGVVSFFGRAFYSFADKYMITGTLRYDGSSKFSGDNVWGVFPSFGASWRLGEEGFIQDLGLFSNLKLRGGWGRVGNEASAQGGSDVANIGTYDMYYVFGGNVSSGGISTNIPTPDLRWEMVETTNVGLDIGVLDGDLNFTADYFIKNTKDMITKLALPDYFPKNRPNANIGEIRNSGIELSANYRKRIGDFTFNVGANLSFIQNEVVKLNVDDDAFLDGGHIEKLANVTRTQKGREIAYFYGYRTDGIFQSQDEIDAYINAENELIQPDAKVGDVKFLDQNGNGEIDPDDRSYLGSGQPVSTYGFNFAVQYKGFDLAANFYGVYGNEIVNGMDSRLLDVKAYRVVYADRLDRFHPTNNPNSSQPRVTLADPNDNGRFSDRYIQDGSYVKLKTLQLGYTLPKSLTKKLKLQKVRVYVAGQNLISFNKYNGYDPEIGDLDDPHQGNDMKSLGIGVDLANFPQPRIFRGGINIQF